MPSFSQKPPQFAPLLRSDTYDLLRIRGDESPELMEQLGRARSITFGSAGQGTGAEVDLSAEDQHYHHLILWHREDQCIAGAYRMGLIDEILSRIGASGVYLDSVFHIDREFYRRVSPSIELSRSFIMPKYQRDSRGLSLLWKGLGRTAGDFGIRNLYGSVTMSNAFSRMSRSYCVAFLSKFHLDDQNIRSLVSPRQPFTSDWQPKLTELGNSGRMEHLAKAVHDYERGERALPPLMRYYSSLGAKFIAFHVEAAFSDALYCLLRVDLEALPAAYRRRFM